MKKSISFALLAVLLLLAGMNTGCRLCCAPYDYCGPIYANGCCSNLARHRCGTAFNQVPQAVYDENGNLIQGAPGMVQGGVPYQPAPQPTPAPQGMVPQPTSAPQTMADPMIPAAGAQMNQYQSGRQQYPQLASNAGRSQAQQQVNYVQAEPQAVSQARAGALPFATAESSSATVLPSESLSGNAAAGVNGSIAVNADGYQKVAVYDEKQQLLGYEIIDATGKSVQQLPAPSYVQ